MARKALLIALVLLFTASFSWAQKKDSLHKAKLNHYSLTLGVGWSHFINNLENFDGNMHNNFVGFTGKFYWEPEHRLSLGLETGYYRLFQVTNQISSDVSVKGSRVVVPLLLLVRMRIVDNFYLGTGMGLAVVTNKVFGAGSTVKTKSWSMSNVELSASYIYPLMKHLQVGGELKGYRFNKMNDWMYTLQALCVVRF